MKNFKELGIHKSFVKGLTEMKIVTPTAIQEQVIPILLNNSTDLVGQAQTGTGKTAAFGLPLLQKINPNDKNIQTSTKSNFFMILILILQSTKLKFY